MAPVPHGGTFRDRGPAPVHGEPTPPRSGGGEMRHQDLTPMNPSYQLELLEILKSIGGGPSLDVLHQEVT